MSVEKSSESSKAAKHVDRERADKERRRNGRKKSEASDERRRESFRETFEQSVDRDKARGDRRSKTKSATEKWRRGRRSEVESSKERHGRERRQASRAEKRGATERSGESGGRRVGRAGERKRGRIGERDQVDARGKEEGSATQQLRGEEGAVGGESVNDGASGGRGSASDTLAEASGAVHRHSGAAETARSEREQRVESIAKEMVRAVRVGRDEQRRRVVMLDLEIPGRGGLNVRMRRDGEGYTIRMRAERSALGAELTRGTSKMKAAMEERGVAVGSIKVDKE